MNICVIGKNKMKFNYLKKKLFTVTQTRKILLMQSTRMQKELLRQNFLENIMIFMFKVMHYCQQMYLVTFEICISKYMNLTLLVFLVKLVKVKLEILIDINMLLMVRKSIRRNMSHHSSICKSY